MERFCCNWNLAAGNSGQCKIHSTKDNHTEETIYSLIKMELINDGKLSNFCNCSKENTTPI